MQGTKIFQEKLFSQFQLSDRVPEENFYRRLKEVLDLEFLYKLMRTYYGDSGQKSIDYHWNLQANKCMQLSAIAYNLKKYMKFIEKRTKSGAGAQAFYFSLKNTFCNLINMLLKPFKTPEF
ncbi:hypothetical protein BWZ22_02020 [Seonamhaeicola sp. S2-3]|uniref:hypothetical protein n=1 Tax=Seonamhaeicola sp. S2-3 TaxID=1936081 RepID=UPI000972D53B|nr:hypothetical protein [Seonamhaeicola sp. S2-3]APY10085.1 hypothetical protein BWZ22_02020 [Seonamhaeicola sp. S2-3]